MPIKITVGVNKADLKFKLNIRKTLDGNFIIFDHPDVDVVVMPEKRKILVLTNDSLNTSSKTYDIQNQIMKFLMKKGIVIPESIHSGNVYGSMEATYPELKNGADGLTATDYVLKTLSAWVEQEKEEWMYEKELKEKEIDRLTDPPADETTNLGKVPHEEKKGGNLVLGGRIGAGW
jgi:hypothetical protein